ncbi:MAG: LysM peptidoglycan-binding domain-containing protein [Chloroflexi bacterium]|jgi:nucleoid-associated protein YgaU|nr:LysM peptidoglycan-binding domain-containing protein [Chloroflexota bacterium]MBT3670769.1 LysM peptidoglycan-binding domain-containing protein [Chloroflexota bacterium]MBT4004142.1 LysM peptidoglycan-binding domain-containing protein [Chloroflexota bacterium]MBT4305137.1 LysM peptidoglycan-binding domain-containing protein [Chloroflexota bacterium]MBT4533341.1 LysM peptidoglycan-binding domain-containing protein [Chloroflexota bacterium]
MVDKKEERDNILKRYGTSSSKDTKAEDSNPEIKKSLKKTLPEKKSLKRTPPAKKTPSSGLVKNRTGAAKLTTDQKKASWKDQIAAIRKSVGPKTIATHTIAFDETLSHVALKYYKNAGKAYYEWIWKNNSEVLGDSPNNTKQGMELNIPELSKELDGTYEPVVPEGFVAVHTVVHDDMLSMIAQKYYGNGNKPYYMWIYEANKDLLGDSPNNTRIGQQLLIPELSEELKG